MGSSYRGPGGTFRFGFGRGDASLVGKGVNLGRRYICLRVTRLSRGVSGSRFLNERVQGRISLCNFQLSAFRVTIPTRYFRGIQYELRRGDFIVLCRLITSL